MHCIRYVQCSGAWSELCLFALLHKEGNAQIKISIQSDTNTNIALSCHIRNV